MNVTDITNYLKDKSQNLESINGTLKLILDGEIIFIDGSGDKNHISNDDQDADCTVIASLDTLKELKDGSLNPMMAMMSGKIKIKGNMMLATKLEKLLK